MKYYEGDNTGAGGQTIFVTERSEEGGKEISRAYVLRHYVRHSPDGFQWGYGGSGPAETARCILIDYFGGNERLAEPLYQAFKWDFIATADAKLFITEREIYYWLRTKGGRK